MTQRFELTLTPEEQAALTHIAATGSALKVRRAQIVLMTAESIPQVDIASEVGLSERQVRRWQRAFQQDRMAIFPEFAAADLPDAPEPPQETTPDTDSSIKPVPDLAKAPPPTPAAAFNAQDSPVIPPPQTPPEATVPGIDVPRLPLKMADTAGIQPDDPMSEAGRKVLHYHFERMLYHEPGSRLGEDIEAVHDMRVATRRMRSAFRAFRPFYRKKAIRPLLRGLRRTASALGTVRDMDVFLEKLEKYQNKSGDDTNSLKPLIDFCIAERDSARADLIAHLDSDDYVQFVDSFAKFLKTPGAGAVRINQHEPTAYQVRHIAPRLIYSRYEAARAYETVLDHASIDTLHALRIECKRLRYAMEFFSEVLGQEIKPVIKEIKKMQDHLGDLNDAQVAGDFLRQFVSDYEDQQVNVRLDERQSIEQVVQYMAYQFAEKHRLTTSFAEAWTHFNRYEVRRDLALAIAAL
jgi:CHAD domain-containing protein